MQPSSVRKSWRSRLVVQAFILVGLFIVASCSAETPAPSPRNRANTCSAPTQACNGACVNTASDATNCGGCGVACVVGQTCQAGRCTLSCTAPQLDCGMCADPTSNALHCGGCNQQCASGQICQNSACVTGSCPVGQVTCTGACVDTLTNPSNCGGCGAACAVGQTCQAGTCSAQTCPLGQSLCGGVCTDIATAANCGGCGLACAVGEACQAGTCVTGGGAGSAGSAGGAGVGAGGNAGAGGTAGAGTGGSAGTGTGGVAGTATGGAGQGGTTAGTTSAGSGGTGPSVPESETCPDITWPTANGSRSLGSGITVAAGQTHDGGMQVHNGSLENCAEGDQDSVDPLIEVANGGTVKNVIMGSNVGDGIHCLGSCTIENVWFPYICDDAISIMGSGTVTIKNSGFKNARDKTIQHNGTATVTIDNVYVETAGKLYRSCGEGCSGNSRTATLSNIVAIGVDQVAGVSENDTVTLRNICVHRTFSICSIYEPGSSDESTVGVNGSNEGPNENCVFSASETHALLSKVGGIPFTTESVCGGPLGYKSGSTATSCVSGFDKCLKACAPGGYGFKEITCTSGRYAEGTGAICAMPTDPTAAQNLAQARVMGATAMVDNNDECPTEWGIGIETSNNANYCVCVHKPGYYSNPNWLAWDCQRRWW